MALKTAKSLFHPEFKCGSVEVLWPVVTEWDVRGLRNCLQIVNSDFGDISMQIFTLNPRIRLLPPRKAPRHIQNRIKANVMKKSPQKHNKHFKKGKIWVDAIFFTLILMSRSIKIPSISLHHFLCLNPCFLLTSTWQTNDFSLNSFLVIKPAMRRKPEHEWYLPKLNSFNVDSSSKPS